jgi:hypothetical protein
MAAENAGWGAPKIHGELLKLGVEVSERTVARYLQRLRRRGDPAKQWLAFLANHRDVNDRRLRLLYRTHADIASPGSWGAVATASVNVRQRLLLIIIRRVSLTPGKIVMTSHQLSAYMCRSQPPRV